MSRDRGCTKRSRSSCTSSRMTGWTTCGSWWCGASVEVLNYIRDYRRDYTAAVTCKLQSEHGQRQCVEFAIRTLAEQGHVRGLESGILWGLRASDWMVKATTGRRLVRPGSLELCVRAKAAAPENPPPCDSRRYSTLVNRLLDH